MRRNEFLLDTHIIIWALTNSPNLNDEMRRYIIDPENGIYISVLSLWEIEIKRLIKPDKLPVTARLVAEYSHQAGFNIIPIQEDNVYQLEWLTSQSENGQHKDPFDRMLICQAISNNMILLTHDSLLKDYGCKNVLCV